MEYGIKKKLNLSYGEAVEKTKTELLNESFGILSEIDVKNTLKKKLDVDMDNYIILGACNPPLALSAIDCEQDIGLLLPCNVIVYEKENKIFVSAINPSVAMSFVKNDELEKIAKEVTQKLQRVVDNL